MSTNIVKVGVKAEIGSRLWVGLVFPLDLPSGAWTETVRMVGCFLKTGSCFFKKKKQF